MSVRSGADKKCPHCGKPAESASRWLLIAALMLGAVLFFWTSGRNRAVSASGGAAIKTVGGRLSAGVISYIGSPEAGKTCGACLASADAFLAEKRQADLREKTKDMAYIPAGEYLTGSSEGEGEPDEHPRRKVRLGAFFIEKYEVTIADYMKFAADTGDNYPEWSKPGGKFNIDTGGESYYKRLSVVLKTCGTCPVIGVTDKNAAAYCKSKNRRLPTEAEWEAAARGGSDAEFSFGDSPARIGDYAWYDGNSDQKPHPVGSRKSNKYGLYDMHGNVWEWVSDMYDKEYYGKSPKMDPVQTIGRESVIRGGSWSFDADSLRSANRASTYKANDDIGFRCAVSESAI